MSNIVTVDLRALRSKLFTKPVEGQIKVCFKIIFFEMTLYRCKWHRRVNEIWITILINTYRPFYNTIFHSNGCCISRMRILRRAKRNNDVYSLSYFKALIDAISCYITQKILILGWLKALSTEHLNLFFNRSTIMCGTNNSMVKRAHTCRLFKVSLDDFSISNLNWNSRVLNIKFYYPCIT
jgi:hypothetical protein